MKENAADLRPVEYLRGQAKPGRILSRNFFVIPIRISMIPIVLAATLLILALVTRAGIIALQRAHPPQGKTIEVAGAPAPYFDLLGPEA